MVVLKTLPAVDFLAERNKAQLRFARDSWGELKWNLLIQYNDDALTRDQLIFILHGLRLQSSQQHFYSSPHASAFVVVSSIFHLLLPLSRIVDDGAIYSCWLYNNHFYNSASLVHLIHRIMLLCLWHRRQMTLVWLDNNPTLSAPPRRDVWLRRDEADLKTDSPRLVSCEWIWCSWSTQTSRGTNSNRFTISLVSPAGSLLMR
jgi:hypothetical protein